MKQGIKIITIWFAIILYCITVMSFIAVNKDKVICHDINIMISDSLESRFVTPNDVLSLIDKEYGAVKGELVNSINTKKIEERLFVHPSVEVAEVYKNIKGELCIDINQRDPVIRCNPDEAEGYYMDAKGYFMPLSESYTAHVPVVTGFLPGVDWSNTPSLNEYVEASRNKETFSKEDQLLVKVFDVATFVHGDSFWKSFVLQLHVSNKGEFEMIPRIGSQLIFFGKPTRMDEKFRNLKALYKKGLSNEGWIQYKTINLKYRNQVICTKQS